MRYPRVAIVGTLVWTLGTLTQTPQTSSTTPSLATETKATRVGDGALALTDQDIAALEGVVPTGAKPWLLYGGCAPVKG
jgi:hypothetical protein